MQKQLKVNLFYNAGQTTYTIPFDFLQKKFIGVKYLPSNYSVLDIDKATPLVYGKDYTVDNKTLTLNQAGDSSKIINIYRETPTDSLVGFTDGSILKADNLNLFDTQILHITEELADYFIIHGRKITTTDDVQNIYIVDSLPDSAVPSDIAIIRSTKCMYQFINNKWELIATPKAQYLLDYETLIKRNETSKTGEANKISFANSEGKLPNNITGSPDKILNKEIDKSTVPTEGTFFVFRNNKFCLEKTIDDSKLSEITTYSSQKIDDTFLHKNGDTVNGNLNITGTITGTLKGNADTATKALQDISGQQIDKTYIKNLNTVDDNIIFTKGDGTNTNKTVNNVKNSIKALQDTRGQQIDVTYIKNLDVNGNQLTVTRGDETVESFAVSGGDGAVIEEYVRRVTGTNANINIMDGKGIEKTITIDNVNNSIKALQDTSGQQINKTYIKDIRNYFDNNQQVPIPYKLIITKGDDTTTVVNVDNSLNVLRRIFHVGYIHMSTVNINPAEIFGFGTWEEMPAGHVLLAQGKVESDQYTHNFVAGETGGEFVHQLTVGEMPSHTPNGVISTKSLIGDFDAFVQKNYTHEWGMCKVLMMRSLAGISGGTAKDKCQYQYRVDATHNHDITFDTIGSNQAHNNIQPYISVYMWKRIA